MVAQSVELLDFNIQYEPRSPMKTQLMSDILTEFARNKTTILDWQTLYVDDVSNVKGSRAWIILEVPNNITLEQTLKLNFRASNNQAKYEALIAGLKLAREVEAKKCDATQTRSLSKDRLPTHTRPRKWCCSSIITSQRLSLTISDVSKCTKSLEKAIPKHIYSLSWPTPRRSGTSRLWPNSYHRC